jgi:hypothetical protein
VITGGGPLLSEQLAALLDLDLAWKRVKSDIAHRVFIGHPYSVELIEFDLQGWLAGRLQPIRNDAYVPSPLFICDVPKGNGLIRPGGHLSYADRLIYAACVGACLHAIQQSLKWSQGTVDFSYQLSFDPANPEWIRDRFTGWKNFDEKSIAKINDGAKFVVVADISAFYENIDIGLLISDIRATDAPKPAVDLLSTCLNKWAQVSGRGIPQGQTPSDILAKLYLNTVDENLRNMGYDHLRYVDDIRVFCDTEVAAKKLLVDLSRLLRRRGLNLQSAKSKILTADDARIEIEGVTEVLRLVRKQFIAEVVQQSGRGDPYIDVSEADEILEASADDTPIEIIQRTYQSYFVEGLQPFNKTLFRFLLKRLAKQTDSFAGLHALSMLEPHPEETHTILQHLKSIYEVDSLQSLIVDELKGGRLVYDYQIYQIVAWFLENCQNPTLELTEFIRLTAFSSDRPRYVRTVCRAFLGNFGTAADLERLADLYDVTTDPSERVEIICSLRRLERGRRNAFFGRVERDGEMNKRAVKWIKAESAKLVSAQQ